MNKNYLLWLVVLLTVLMPQQLLAQKEQFQPEKRIYLWDVTLSMKGYNGSPDIYDVVRDALIEDINKVTDPNVEIVVMPFQVGVLAEWVSNATPNGKKQLIQNILDYKNELITYTNILTPFKHAVRKYIDETKCNILMIMTDGEHNDPSSSKSLLIKEIELWGQLCESVNAYAFYVILTAKADDKDVKKAITETKGIEILDNITDIDLTRCQLTPQAVVVYNVKDDIKVGCTMSIKCNQSTYPDNVLINIKARNEYIEVDSDTLIEDGQIKFKVITLEPLSKMPERFDLDMYLKLKNSDKNDRVFLIKDNCKLTIINKKEKVLKIYVK